MENIKGEEAAKYNRKPGQIKVKDLDGDGKIDATHDRLYPWLSTSEMEWRYDKYIYI